MKRQNGGEVKAFFEELKETDPDYAAYSDRFGALAEFMTEYEFAKESQNITQEELAKRADTTQSAISRFESMKHPPSYDLLVRISKALGDKLFLSPLGSLSVSLPFDLHKKAKTIAERRGQTVRELMENYVRKGIQWDDLVVCGVGRFQATVDDAQGRLRYDEQEARLEPSLPFVDGDEVLAG